jgi:hypothetical protein
MRKASLMVAGLFSIASLGLVGCDVEKTQEGNLDLPKYEVEKTAEGDVTVPKYDVDAPDVNVSTVERQVTVPKVTTEEERIALPKVEITPAEDKDDGKENKS